MGKIIRSIRERIAKRRYNKLTPEQQQSYNIMVLRMELSRWGHDVSNLTDQEILDGQARGGELIRATGVSSEQLKEVTKQMARVLESI